MLGYVKKLFFLTIIIIKTSFCFGKNPLLNFYFKNQIHEEIVIISLDVSTCGSCITPIDNIIEKIKKINYNVPIYIIVNDSLTNEGKINFSKKNNININFVNYIYDKYLFNYLVRKTNNIPNISVISEYSKIQTLKNLKNDDLSKIFKLIIPNFEITLNRKIAITNKFISFNNGYDGLLSNNNFFYIFKRGLGLISSYSRDGMNIKNLFFDSLNLNYLKLAKYVFNKEDYESSILYFSKNNFKQNQFISPISIMKIENNLIGVNIEIKSFKDSLYKKDTVTFEETYNLIVLLDADLKLKRLLRFNPNISKDLILHSQSIFIDSIYCFLRFDRLKKQYLISEFRQLHTDLFLIREYPEPHTPSEKDPIQIISNYEGVLNTFYITYNNSNRSKSIVYKNSIRTKTSTLAIKLKNTFIPGYFISETIKGNYVFLNNNKGVITVKGYDIKEKKLIKLKENDSQKTNCTNCFYFLFEGYIHEVKYSE